jgi:O-glycosyl hydrolase
VGAQDFTVGAGRRTWLALAAAAVAAATFASPAAGAIVAQPERLTVKASRLTVGERRAITLESLGATADGSLGLIVTATFRGNVERYLGQRDLAKGLVALVLIPTHPAPRSMELVDEGGGFTPTRVPIADGHTQIVDVFNPEHVLHRQTPPGTEVLRNGTRITFFLAPTALSGLASVELKVFARPGGRPAEVARLAVDQSELGYTQLAGPRDALSGLVSTGIDPELRAQRKSHATIADALSRQPRLPHLTKVSLAVDLKLTSRRQARLKAESNAVNRLVARLNALISARTPPPPPPPPPPAPPPPPQPNVQVVQTDPALSQDMAPQPGLTTSSTPPQGVAETIVVNEQLRYQQFRGLGAAMTDSSAYVFNGMPATDRAALIQNLFGQPNAGSTAPSIHLNFLRLGIGATGAMTVGPAYSYDDNPPGGTDANLDHFALTSDDTSYIIPTLQQVLQTNPNLEILANPWSPPAWMKSNDSLGNTNHAGDLLSQYYQSYANYFVKFIRAYTQAGIPIDGITPANEPTSGSGGTAYPGLNFPESDEAQFIADNLQPALTQAGLHPEIYGSDLSWDRYAGYASPLAADASAGPDLTGIAWHCYFGSPTVMSQLQQTNPDLDQIVDECSPEIRGFGTPEFLISTLRNWASVVAAWSIALEPDGQPIQTPNSCGGCRGLVSVDPSTGAVTYRSEYYQFGQVSAFVQPGARRIDSPNFVAYGTNGSNIETISSGLDDVTFINPDGSKVLVAYNNSTAPITFAVASDGSYFSYAIPAGAMTTFVWH